MPELQPHILMCPPEFYGIHYEINPWMDQRQPADHAVAVRQWNALRAELEACGAAISLLPPVEGLPDMVFTANAALIYRDRAVISRFRHAERRGEQPYAEQWLAQHGFQVQQSPADIFFEGAGDALFCGETLFAGYRIRSDVRGHQEISASLNTQVIAVELVDEYYYHLDTCLCPLDAQSAIYFPDAFDHYGLQVLQERVDQLISVCPEEAQRFACNAVVLGDIVITNTGCPQLHAELKRRGYQPRATPLDEFVKAGGSAKCLTLRLDGEDAASWRKDVP
ncbi:MAG: amidinotransferase [Planctomycetales bacterium]|nr:amidinotransferase [Planctomycetales bacterium]NIM07662.1 amidinotransferase [Planctomycetales bacterium]NIN07167.1 amidinotransferase [Planctomycetales bacterium]NIN76260.1 amidinotransferase [Planctomycetales bacterium]NIO33476.1 amidinotransferase [Planctomycetales bacterium]